MDFFIGRVTREHSDIDWFAFDADEPGLRQGLLQRGFTDVTSTAAGQQIDLVRGRVEHGIALVRLSDCGEPVVAAGPWAGEPWPAGMLDGPIGRINDISARIIAPSTQIEIKQMTPIWNPALARRQKDLDDIVAIRAKMA